MSIQPLPDGVISQIKSSATITSLNGVVLELMKNSLDAGSTKIDASVDYSRGGCIVEDDGLGILPSEFGEDGGLGKLYHSSKLNSHTPVHGSRGTFLGSLSAMSLLSITSHHHLHRSRNTLSMHKSKIVSRQVPAPALQYLSRFDQGTRVTVRNLFGNMPVRVKQRAVTSEKQGATTKEWDSLKASLVLLILAWPKNVEFKLQELVTGQKMAIGGPSNLGQNVDVPRICRILFQSSFILHEEIESWVSVGASTSNWKVSGRISLDPSPTKHVQFLSFDIQPLIALEGQSILHDEINRLFLNSAFGNEEGEELDEAEISRKVKGAKQKGDGYSSKELKGGKKGVDRWPMFYVNIQRKESSSTSKDFNIDDILENKANSLKAMTDLLEAMILEFLAKYHFWPKAPRGQLSRDVNYGKVDLHIEGRPSSHRDHKSITFTRSPSKRDHSIRPARVEKKTPSKIRSTHQDLLGGTVKLPSFRRSSSTFETPFDAWSRIKSGAAKRAEKTSELPCGQIIQRPSTAPPPCSTPVTKSDLSKPAISLLSMTGKVIRRPFEDIPAASSRLKSAAIQPHPTHSPQHKAATPQTMHTPINLTQEDENDMVTWVNPITKVESLINKRTGHTVPALNNTASPSLSRSLFHSHPSSGPKLPNGLTNSNPSESNHWLTSTLENWENPVFRLKEPSIPKLSIGRDADGILHGCRHNCSQLDVDLAFSETSLGIARSISKSALKNAEVVGQLDRKFILVKLPSSQDEKGPRTAKMLDIIDQHAADERIRIENLLAELCTPPPPRLDGMPTESGILTTYLEKGLMFEVSNKDAEPLRLKKDRFAEWGILYDLLPSPTKLIMADNILVENKTKQRFTVRALPPGIAERCKSDSKLLIELIRTELYSSSDNKLSSLSVSTSSVASAQPSSKTWLAKINTCPKGILDMLNSRACRSAIMFNDILSKEQCQVLVQRLAETAFPFQCAHGRPSLLPLVELGSVPQGQASNHIDERGSEGFGKMYNIWKAGVEK